jgi:DNA polymerase elongation subunit (family B)
LTTTITTTTGWLFDAYPQSDRMVFWIKQGKDDKIVRLEDNSWSHSIYVASDNKHDLASVAKDKRVSSFIKHHEFVKKYEKITDKTKSEVLKLTLTDSSQAQQLAKHIMLDGRFGQLRPYNVDVLPAQSYFYEHGIFPLAFCEVTTSGGNGGLRWSCKDDDVWSIDYTLPEFKTIHLSIKPRKQDCKLPKFTDKIDSISIRNGNEEKIIEIDGTDEAQILFSLTEMMSALDPDFVFTEAGDSFGFPYLVYRAEVNYCNNILVLGREPDRATTRRPIKDGTTYFSYGRKHYRPSSTQLFGRVHIDKHNSFILNDAGMQGLYEVARLCRMPLHTASRASIGRCMSSLQCYNATVQDILIPWKSAFAEHFKTYSQLFVADRGGMIFEPRVGVHEQVGEFDFSSLYPSIMSAKNLSGETVLCTCCPESKLRVPELGWHICEKKIGIVPQSLEILLKKRAQYKQLLKSHQMDPKTKQVHDARQGSLKWILVTSFGYLGYSNSKFGNIDAHIATCAFDRQVVLKAVRVAESHGFKVLHGIVDSMWVVKQGAVREDYLRLKEAIEQHTGFAISFEGIYKWVAFVHSKSSKHVPVPNRYFGVFEDDGSSLKVRGLEIRRRDNPPFFDKFQAEVLKIIAKGNTIEEVRMMMPQVKDAFNKYMQLLKDRKVPLQELVFTKQLSKDSHSYVVNTIERTALRQLAAEGRLLRAGEVLQYVITDYYSNKRSSKRATPIEMIDDKTGTYDVRRYIELLAETARSVTEPFNFHEKIIAEASSDYRIEKLEHHMAHRPRKIYNL